MNIKTNLSSNGLNDVIKKLDNMKEKLKSYDGTHKISVPYSEEQWQTMTETEKNEAILEAKNKFIEDMRKDIMK